ncbi:hypothetical protein [Cryobacterium sp. Y50]|uniref:hypothetical protein n=1 Tax=Cryobacterium sp. Y50 TaxID=2048286 RepID=UPI0011B04C89|nr:hypothetical protein [Cryobacterium sp. Y50]
MGPNNAAIVNGDSSDCAGVISRQAEYLIEGFGHNVEGRFTYHAVRPPGGEAIITSDFGGRIPDEGAKQIGERVDEDISGFGYPRDFMGVLVPEEKDGESCVGGRFAFEDIHAAFKFNEPKELVQHVAEFVALDIEAVSFS